MQVDHHGDGEQAGVKMSNDCIVRIFRITAPCHRITDTDTIAEQVQIQVQIHYEYKHILRPGFVWFVPHHMCKIVYVCGTLCIVCGTQCGSSCIFIYFYFLHQLAAEPRV